MDFFKKLQNVDRRLIYLVLLIAVAGPMIKPIGIPLSINQSTIAIFDQIEALDPATDMVLLSLDYSPGGSPDVHPQTIVVTEHLIRRGIKFVMVSFWDAGPMFGEQVLAKWEAEGYTYGTDFINLGYMAGQETAIKAFGDDPKGSFTTDFRGNRVADMPIMANVNEIRDFELVIDFVSGNPGFQEWIRQVQGPHGINFAVGIVTVSVPQVIPFINAGQVTGMLQGLRGAAEYELLLGAPGAGAAKMDGQSIGHLVIIAFILVGNIAYFLEKKTPGKK